jgi:hypothetical protein
VTENRSKGGWFEAATVHCPSYIGNGESSNSNECIPSKWIRDNDIRMEQKKAVVPAITSLVFFLFHGCRETKEAMIGIGTCIFVFVFTHPFVMSPRHPISTQ